MTYLRKMDTSKNNNFIRIMKLLFLQNNYGEKI